MTTNVNTGICHSRIQQGKPAFFVNWTENGENNYKFSNQRFEIEQLKNKLTMKTDDKKKTAQRANKRISEFFKSIPERFHLQLFENYLP